MGISLFSSKLTSNASFIFFPLDNINASKHFKFIINLAVSWLGAPSLSNC